MLWKMTERLTVDPKDVQAVFLANAEDKDKKNFWIIQFVLRNQNTVVGSEVFDHYSKVEPVYNSILERLEVLGPGPVVEASKNGADPSKEV